MARQTWKPGTMVYPVPAAMVTVADKAGNTNIITIAWTGTVCSDPPMTYVSIKPERYSHHMVEETGEFVINLTTKDTAFATDYCGVKSGRDVDKWKEMGLTPGKASKVSVPIIEECPVNIECRVTEVKRLGSHDMFLAEVDSAVGGGKLREGAGALADERNQVVEAGQLIQGVPVQLRELDGHLMEAAPDEGEKIFGLSFHGDLLSLVMTL